MPQAFVFPGQGSQSPGMGRDLVDAYPAARGVFQEVDDALGQDLSRLMFEGPEEQLVLTENAQPALLTVSMAVVSVLEERFGTPLSEQADFFAGHSVGEYSALAAAGAISLTDAARLVQARGRAIQEAVPVGVGAMAAILGLPYDDVWQLARNAATEDEICQIANHNAPTEMVISGHRPAVERAIKAAKSQGAKTVLLSVSAPFHCPLLEPAARKLEAMLDEIEIVEPAVPIVANVTATPLGNPDAIRRRLVEQMTEMVRWCESVEFLRDQGVDLLVELGAGSILTQVAGRIDDSLTAVSVSDPRELEDYLARLAELQGSE